MALFDNNFTDELRARLSIVDIVNRHIPLVKKGNDYWGCCPFHNEKTPSFSVNESKNFFHCFGCGVHGDIISFTMKINNMNYPEAIKELADMAGLKIPEKNPKTPQQIQKQETYYKILDDAAKIFQEKLFSPDGKVALEYIHNRGFSDDMIKKYRIGYAPKNNLISNKFINHKQENLISTGLVRHGDYGLYDFFRHKLMFPIFNATGHIVAFSGRSLDGSEPKYINTSDTELFHKKNTIFGFNFARDSIHRSNRSIIVEGQIDAIQMQCNGFGETVAPLGTALTENHIGLLCKANRNIIFCFDGDVAGKKAAVRACGLVMPFLHDNSDVRFAFVTGGKDPDEILKTAGKDAMKKIIDDAIPLVDFLWKVVNSEYQITTPNGRTQAEKYLQQELKKIKDPILKSEYENDYNQRKFNQWHKWKHNNTTVSMAVPEIDNITKNTLIYIINTYDELAERYGDFLQTLNIDFDVNIKTTIKLSFEESEKYLYSLRLTKELEFFEQKKKELTSKVLNGDTSLTEELNELNKKIQKQHELQHNLVLTD